VAPLLPIFVLDTVLMPGAALPLHVFEPRYRQLVIDVQQAGQQVSAEPAFGVVCVRRGAPAVPDITDTPGISDKRVEVVTATGDSLCGVGTLAAIIRAEPYADGRSDLVTVGRRRFRLTRLEPDGAPYLRAAVDWLPEDDGDVSAALLDKAQQRCSRYLGALGALVGTEPGRIEYASDPMTMSYQVANRIRLTSAERQELLEADTAALRLRAALRLLRRELALLPRTRSIPVAASALHVETSVN
jgi:hypothetical protein